MNNIEYVELIETLVTEMRDSEKFRRLNLSYYGDTEGTRAFNALIQQDVIYYLKLPLDKSEKIKMLVTKLAKIKIENEKNYNDAFKTNKTISELSEVEDKIRKEYGIS